MSERAFSQDARNLVVAHRGASAEAPENTIEAFERAIVLGADALEFDVRLTADGVPVVLHDADVGRTTDGSGAIVEMSHDRVRALRIDGRHRVPTLHETLSVLSGRIAVDIELKNIPGEPGFTADAEPLVEATLEAIASSGFEGVVLLSSFNPASIARARALAPEVPTGLLTEHTTDARAALTFAASQSHPWVLPYVGMLRAAGDGFVEEVHAVGLRLGTWITDDPAEALALFRGGVDAVATNDPAAVVAARDREGR